ncbi:MAG: thioredoxin family protein [Fluviicola sp.]|nr:MAG: thioredoxin family protein [Fluviicola sp.]
MKNTSEISESQNIVSWSSYIRKFDEILNSETPLVPYDDPAYLNYLKLNRSRQKRWLKTGVIHERVKQVVSKIKTTQTWYIITEPWCGDAAHSIPFLKLIADLNPLINLNIVWRDTPPLMIEKYLTNGGKSVPKLVIRDEKDRDLGVWGPRPEECQTIYLDLKEKEAKFEEVKVTLQNWYNEDKGHSLQNEMIDLLERTL